MGQPTCRSQKQANENPPLMACGDGLNCEPPWSMGFQMEKQGVSSAWAEGKGPQEAEHSNAEIFSIGENLFFPSSVTDMFSKEIT